MDEDDDMDFGYTEKPPSSDPPRRPGGGGPPGPGRPSGGPPRRPPGDPDGPPGDGVPGATWRWIVYLRRMVQVSSARWTRAKAR